MSSSENMANSIVVLKNRGSDLILANFSGELIQASSGDESDLYHQWYRIPVVDDFVAYRNVATGLVLDHFRGESIQASIYGSANHYHHWSEQDVDKGFVAIRNRETNKVLDHYESRSIAAYDADVAHQNQQWVVSTPRPSFIVGIKNRGTGMVLAHLSGQPIQASNNDERDPHLQWYRIPVVDDFVAYRNVATGMVLDHFRGESIQAFTNDLTNHYHHWIEENVGDEFVAIRNRKTENVLVHHESRSIEAKDADATHQNHQWVVSEVDDGLNEEELNETMLISLPRDPDMETQPFFFLPVAAADSNSRRQFSVGNLMNMRISQAILLLLRRFLDISGYLQRDEAPREIDQMYPLFRPMPDSNGVQLFAHHDIVLTMVNLFNNYRTSDDTFDRILSRLGTHLIRDIHNSTREGLRTFLSRSMVDAIVNSIWNSNRLRGDPDLEMLSQEQLNSWRDFVPLPLSDQVRAINSHTEAFYDQQVAPLNLWELVVLFFRIIEAHLRFEHRVGLSRFSLRYNGILIAPNTHRNLGHYGYRLIRGGELDLLRLRNSDAMTDVGMWHIVTFHDVLMTDDPSVARIPDFSVGFVLHTSDPNSRLVVNQGNQRPFSFVPVVNANHRSFIRTPNARIIPGPHYHLTTFPGGLHEIRRWINAPDEGRMVYLHLLRVGMHFYVDPNAVNGLENLDANSFTEQEDEHDEL